MNRRDILKYTALLSGSAVLGPLSGAILSGCTPQPKAVVAGASGQFFDASGMQLLTTLVDTILPATDSPSASQVGVQNTIDDMFAQAFTPDYQQSFNIQFKALQDYLNQQDFLNLDGSSQLAVLQKIDASSNNELVKQGLLDIKQHTVAYYLSSEQIAENFLNYLPIPGEFKPCVPLKELGGKAWAI